MTWAERVKALRQRRGWSQSELARRLGVQESQVSRWECKTQNLPHINLADDETCIKDYAENAGILGRCGGCGYPYRYETIEEVQP